MKRFKDKLRLMDELQKEKDIEDARVEAEA
jgi:hypothetical protein